MSWLLFESESLTFLINYLQNRYEEVSKMENKIVKNIHILKNKETERKIDKKDFQSFLQLILSDYKIEKKMLNAILKEFENAIPKKDEDKKINNV
jgi:hypothetical protein